MTKTFIVTGANRGLGQAFVDALIKDKDCFVISLSRSLSEEQKNYSKNNFHFVEVDLSKQDVSEKIKVLNNLIKTDDVCFINNASIIEPISKIEDLDETSIDTTLAVNVKSTMLITQYLLKNYSSNSLKFMNISSGAANRAISNWALYCSSKAFIQMFYNVAQSEYKQHRFFNIDPGVMDTNMQKSLRESDFPDVENFKDLQNEGKLKSPKQVAIEILKTIDYN
jgi:benzil reductase ((S)-benzoin forming)